MLSWIGSGARLLGLRRTREVRHRLHLDGLDGYRVELCRREAVWRIVLRVRVDDCVLWRRQVGLWSLVRDMLAGIAGLPPTCYQHSFRLDGRRFRVTVCPSLGLGALEPVGAASHSSTEPATSDSQLARS